MRSRSIRLTIVIVLILGLALAALGFRSINIDLPGLPALEREGAGPLGLKLGLDLSGGGHLVYQADTGTRFEVTLLEPASLEEIGAATEGFRFGESGLALEDYQILPRDVTVEQREAAPAGDAESVAPGADPTDDGSAAAGADGSAAAAGDGSAATTGDGSAAAGDGSTATAGDGSTATAGDGSTAAADGSGTAAGDDATPEPEGELSGEPQLVNVPVASVFQIRTGLLAADDPRRTGLREAIEESLGPVSVFQAVDIGEPTPDQMAGVLGNITARVNRFGTEEPIIQIFGDDRIIVQLPGASGSTSEVVFAEAASDIARNGMMAALTASGYVDAEVERLDGRSFRIRSATVDAEAEAAAIEAVEMRVGPLESFTVSSEIDEAKALIGQTALLEFRERTCGSVDPVSGACYDPTDADLGLSGGDVERAEAAANQVGVGWVVNLQFDGRGADIFSELTRRIAGVESKRIAVFMDGRELIAPVARAWIRDGRTEISGSFTREEARTLAIQLESGRLQVPLKLIQESDVDALLGSESLRNSLLAGLVGLGLVLAFMVAYYRMAGVVAACALAFYAVIVLAAFKLIPITLELAHIGGFILSVGMAVDANILIFERMKEEVRIGRTLASSMEVGFGRAWPAIRDSNISTMITCLVLMWFGDRLGGGLVTGVAISLFIGVAASMFTAVVVSRNLLQLLAFAGLGHRIRLFTPESVPGTAPSAGGGR